MKTGKDRPVRISKYLSKHPRHRPECLGLDPAPGGRVRVEVLPVACAAHDFPLSREEQEEVVARNDKRRFSFDDTGERIRADQGHGIGVDLQLAAAVAPPLLYHGSGEHSVRMIMECGLLRTARHHVHLPRDVETANGVGGGARSSRRVGSGCGADGRSRA